MVSNIIQHGITLPWCFSSHPHNIYQAYETCIKFPIYHFWPVEASFSSDCMSVSYAVPYWNVPLLPSYCLDSTLDSKNSFKTLIRVIGSASSFADAFSYFFDLYKWHRVVLVSDVSSGICTYGMNAIASRFQANTNITIAEWIQLTNEANDVELDNALDRITQRGRS